MKTSAIHIRASDQKLTMLDFSEYATGQAGVSIIIESSAQVVIQDTCTPYRESLEIIVEPYAKVVWITNCIFGAVTIRCASHSSISFVQVIGKSPLNMQQHIILCMEQEHAHANLVIFPLLKESEHIECITEQKHESSMTSSDVRICGQLEGSSSFGHCGMIKGASMLHNVNIMQKTVLFLSGIHAHAYARPCFDIASCQLRCTHGAAIGAIDKNQLWYLQARGIIHHEAKRLIIQARCIDCLDKHVAPDVFEFICSMIAAGL